MGVEHGVGVVGAGGGAGVGGGGLVEDLHSVTPFDEYFVPPVLHIGHVICFPVPVLCPYHLPDIFYNDFKDSKDCNISTKC